MQIGRLSLRARVRMVLAAALVAGLALAMPSAHASGPISPDKDPFYTYSGSTSLSHIAPGTVLKTRSIQIALGTHKTPVKGEQLLYRTTGQLGEPTVTVTTILLPKHLQVAPKLVGYLSFYDGLGAKCDPSFTLAGGNGGPAITQQAEEEELLMAFYVEHGFIVTVPDFEGTGLHWMAGRESGYGTLDGIKATESFLHLPKHTPVGMSGYSGGALAGDWAAELAPSYAPTLNIAGVALGGIPVDYWHMFDYINGDKTNSSVMPGMLLGISRAYHLDLTPYLSSYGAQLVHAQSDVCITSEFGKYPGLTMAKIMKPQYADLHKVPVFRKMLNDLIMGTVPGRPRTPFLMGNGNKDGIGDGVMKVGDVRALAHEYCKAGIPVEFHQYRGLGHVLSGAAFDPETGPYLQDRLNGVPAVGDCRFIGPGNDINPE